MNKKVKLHLLLVEDDIDLGRLIFQVLDPFYHVYWVKTIASAKKTERSNKIDVAVLDIMLPDGSGLDLTSYFHAHSHNKPLPILLLSALGDINNKITGLRQGADDYLTKPFEIEELLLRLEKIQHRYINTAMKSIDVWGLSIDLTNKTISFNTQSIECSSLEFEVLAMFMSKPNQLINREKLFGEVWRNNLVINTRVVDTTIARLRKKLALHSNQAISIISVRGYGYKLIQTNSCDGTS